MLFQQAVMATISQTCTVKVHLSFPVGVLHISPFVTMWCFWTRYMKRNGSLLTVASAPGQLTDVSMNLQYLGFIVITQLNDVPYALCHIIFSLSISIPLYKNISCGSNTLEQEPLYKCREIVPHPLKISCKIRISILLESLHQDSILTKTFC